MRLRGNTDVDDWNLITLLWIIWHGGYKAWSCGWDDRPTYKDHQGFLYTWYDGPIWQLSIGRLWIAIGYFW